MFRFIFASIFVLLLLAGSIEMQINCVQTCTPPSMCDTNTGQCRTFRQAFNGPVQLPCSVCPSGTQCDTNTGICRTFRNP